eukprot:1112438-Amphidinium_carterae.1
MRGYALKYLAKTIYVEWYAGISSKNNTTHSRNQQNSKNVFYTFWRVLVQMPGLGCPLQSWPIHYAGSYQREDPPWAEARGGKEDERHFAPNGARALGPKCEKEFWTLTFVR